MTFKVTMIWTPFKCLTTCSVPPCARWIAVPSCRVLSELLKSFRSPFGSSKSISFCTLILLCVLVHWVNTIANVTACILDCLVTPLIQLLYSGVSFFSGKWCLPSNPWETWRDVYVHHICAAVRGKTYTWLVEVVVTSRSFNPTGLEATEITPHCTPLLRDNMLEIREPWVIWHVWQTRKVSVCPDQWVSKGFVVVNVDVC
jgi:hypothetical protein